MVKTRMNLLSVLVLCCVLASCASPAPVSTPTTVPATPTPPLTATATRTPLPTAVPATPTPVDLGPLPTPPPTAVPEAVNIEFVGVISSEPNRVPIPFSAFEPSPYRPPYHYIVVTMYITQVTQGKEYVKPGDTVILHDHYHLAPDFSDEQLQAGMTFHIRGAYQVDTGVLPEAEIIKDLGEATMYEPPPVVGGQGDITRIVIHFEPLAINTWPGTLVSNLSGDVTLWLIDKNWAQVVTGTVRLGEVINLRPATIEILKTLP